MPASPARTFVTPLHAVLVAAGGALAALYWYAPYAGPFDRTLAVIGVQFVLFGVAAVAVVRSTSSTITLAIVLVFACVFRVAALNYTPFLSSDVYRYVWDGRVQAAGVNPYRYLPADPALASLRDEVVYPNINRRETARTIYPPLGELLFYGVTRIHDSVFAMRVAMVVFEALAIAGIVMLLGWLSLPRAHILLFAWHPLAVWEIASSGHLDAVVLAAMAAAFLAHHRSRSRVSVTIIGLATLVKLYPLALLPVFWRRWDWTSLALIGLLATATYAPYAAGAGWGVLGYLPGYLAEEGFRTGDRFFLIDLARRAFGIAISPMTYLAVAAAGLGALALRAIALAPIVGRRQVAFALVLATAATLVVSPAYPWYFLWLLPCLPVVPSVPLLMLTGAGFVQYVRHVPGSTATGYDLNVVQYVGFAVIALGTALLGLVRGRRRPSVLSGDPV
jgi:hypothetical protein